MTDAAQIAADFHCHVLPGHAFSVVGGANLGDSLLGPEALCLGDAYRLAPESDARLLAVCDSTGTDGQVLAPESGQIVATGSEIGTPGAAFTLAARLTFLAPEGHKSDLLLLALDDSDARSFAALPVDPMEPGRSHTLAGIDTSPGPVRLADVTAPGFCRGTRITLADGAQARVETLRAGMSILTRDHGAQPLRHVLHRTLRTVGPFAPVVIRRGTFGNEGDLVLSQQQRLFVYQRENRLTETAEVLVRAGYLVDKERIFLRPGGFADFYGLIFERHEVVYAECIPVESHRVNPAALPEDLVRELPEIDDTPSVGTEADRETARTARAQLLKDRNR